MAVRQTGWAMLAANRYDAETIITQSRRALNYLHPNNLPVRTNVTRTLGYAYHLQGDRAAARRAYAEAVKMCEASGNIFINILATTALGIIQEAENQQVDLPDIRNVEFFFFLLGPVDIIDDRGLQATEAELQPLSILQERTWQLIRFRVPLLGHFRDCRC